MPPRLKEFLQRWAIITLAVLIAEWLVPGIHSPRWTGLLAATLILGTLNMILRPLLIAGTVAAMAGINVLIGVKAALLTLPLQVFLFAFLLLAINAGLLLFVAAVVPSFHVAGGFWTAFWGGVVISLATLIMNSITGTGHARISVQRGKGPPRSGGPDSGGGPIIDV
jgi:putative membrane protein